MGWTTSIGRPKHTHTHTDTRARGCASPDVVPSGLINHCNCSLDCVSRMNCLIVDCCSLVGRSVGRLFVLIGFCVLWVLGAALMRRKAEQQKKHPSSQPKQPAPVLSSPRRVGQLRGATGDEPAAPSPITAESSPGGTALMRRKMEQQHRHNQEVQQHQRQQQSGSGSLQSPRLMSPRRVDQLRGNPGETQVAHSPITAASSPGGTALMRRKMEQQHNRGVAAHNRKDHPHAPQELPSTPEPRRPSNLRSSLLSPKRVDQLRASGSGSGEVQAAHSPITAASSPGGTALMRRKMEQQQQHLLDAQHPRRKEPPSRSPHPSQSQSQSDPHSHSHSHSQVASRSPRRVERLRATATAASPAAHSPITAASSPGGTALMRRKMERDAHAHAHATASPPPPPPPSDPRQRPRPNSGSQRTRSPQSMSPRRVDALRNAGGGRNGNGSGEIAAHSPITAASSPGGSRLLRRKLELQRERQKLQEIQSNRDNQDVEPPSPRPATVVLRSPTRQSSRGSPSRGNASPLLQQVCMAHPTGAKYCICSPHKERKKNADRFAGSDRASNVACILV